MSAPTDRERAPAANGCDNCGKPLATQADFDAHPDGCQCDRCRSLCWRAWNTGGVCHDDPAPWRSLYFAARAREGAASADQTWALVDKIDRALGENDRALDADDRALLFNLLAREGAASATGADAAPAVASVTDELAKALEHAMNLGARGQGPAEGDVHHWAGLLADYDDLRASAPPAPPPASAAGSVEGTIFDRDARDGDEWCAVTWSPGVAVWLPLPGVKVGDRVRVTVTPLGGGEGRDG